MLVQSAFNRSPSSLIVLSLSFVSLSLCLCLIFFLSRGLILQVTARTARLLSTTEMLDELALPTDSDAVSCCVAERHALVNVGGSALLLTLSESGKLSSQSLKMPTEGTGGCCWGMAA